MIQSNLSQNTISSYYKDIDQLFTLLINQKLSNEELLKKMYEIVEVSYKGNSLFRKTTSVNKFRAFLARQKLINTEVVKAKKYFSKQSTAISELQEQKYFELITFLRNKFRDSLIVEVLYETGIRLNELLNLKVENIVFKRNEPFILINRKLIISKQLSTRLAEFCSHKNQTELIFQGPKGKLNPKTVREIIQEAGENVGIFNLSPSSFRVSFIKKLITLKMNDQEIAYLAGVKSINNLTRYRL